MTDAPKFAPNSTVPLADLSASLPEVPTDVYGFPMTSHHSFAVSFAIMDKKTNEMVSLGMQLVSLDPATYEEVALKMGLKPDSDEYREASHQMLIQQVMDQHDPEISTRGHYISGGAIIPLTDHVIYPRDKPSMSNYKSDSEQIH